MADLAQMGQLIDNKVDYHEANDITYETLLYTTLHYDSIPQMEKDLFDFVDFEDFGRRKTLAPQVTDR